ncbi:hypothetical protein AURDEDRAFT_176700 [Auricularia subglabra TFB-10046 SS5]|uniref:Uncharacterized protein n=1 Tax=Auricularia subglabra (strain TFB-10046 / SS5) TaxID=717982 RepID=J0WPA9_AURST|nr:hypothetical protein AURDEDRAFT_176700 [Auricularia subglabra TFB-10046 SS5]
MQLARAVLDKNPDALGADEIVLRMFGPSPWEESSHDTELVDDTRMAFARLGNSPCGSEESSGVVPGFRLSSFVNDDQSEWTAQKMPAFQPQEWKGSEPLALCDEDDVAVLYVFPNFLGKAAGTILSARLVEMGKTLKIKPDAKSTDSGGRDNPNSYKRRMMKGEISGTYNMVDIWTAIGHSGGQAGPAAEVVAKNVQHFVEARKTADHLRVSSMRIDHVIQCVDPEQHRLMHQAAVELRSQCAAYRDLSYTEPTYFHGKVVHYNRATSWHRDKLDKRLGWNAVLTEGSYTQGIFRALGHAFEYLPGTLILIRGAVIPHSADFDGGQRVGIAYLTRDDLIARTSIGPLPLMTCTEVLQHMAIEDERRRVSLRAADFDRARRGGAEAGV